MGELASAYTTLLNHKLNPGGCENYVVYDYVQEFEKFWLDEPLKNGPNQLPQVASETGNSGQKALIIVWDSLPPDEGSAKLGQHLTPLDWALAFSTQVLKHGLKGVNPFSIHIVDLTSTQYENAFAMQMAASICETMPWVKLYAPLPRGRRAYEERFPVDELASNKWPEEKTTTLPKGPGWKSLDRLDKLNQAWRAWVVQSDDHHDVNNVIGPDILSKTDECHKGLTCAFLTRLAWSGHDDIKEAGNWEPWETDAVKDDLFGRPLKVLVVDDQLQNGWGRFVCKLFGCKLDKLSSPSDDQFSKLGENAKETVSVYGSVSPNPLLKFLANESIYDSRIFSHQIHNPSNSSKPFPEIIFLDLRLYANSDDARRMTGELLKIVKELPGRLAWPGINENEIGRIVKWQREGTSQECKASIEALLLLPRLLAMAVPLTPIILFSSTGQSWIKEKLKDYRNVFTGFEKPRVLSNPELVKDSISSIRNGLDKAVMMLRLRLQLAHAQVAVRKANELRERISFDTAGVDEQHIEIYVDETLTIKEGIISGLAVCCYPAVDKAKKLQEVLLNEFTKNDGIVWAQRNSKISPQLEKGKDIAHSQAAVNDQVAKITTLFDVNGLEGEKRNLWSVVATRVNPTASQINDISLAAFYDGPLDDALRYNLEFTLFVLIPFFTKKSFEGQVYIFIPTRVVPFFFDDRRESNDHVEKLSAAFDLGIFFRSNPRNLAPPYQASVSTSSLGLVHTTGHNLGTAFPLIRGWIHSWRIGNELPCIAKKIRKIGMTTLEGGGKRKIISLEQAQDRVLFHDIADWVCTASNPNKGDCLKAKLKDKNIFPHWFISTDTKINDFEEYYRQDTRNAMILMQALHKEQTRNFNSSSTVDVLRLVLRNSYIASCDQRLICDEYCAQQQLILWKLSEQIKNASGRDLHALLADKTEKQATNSANNKKAPGPVASMELPIVEPQNELPEEFPDDERERLCPNSQRYYPLNYENENIPKQLNCTTSVDSIRITHSIKNTVIINQLYAQKWSNPLVVLGEEIGKRKNGIQPIKVLAAHSANGNWKPLAE